VLYHSDLVDTLGWLAHQVQAKHGLMVQVQAQAPIGPQPDAIKAFLYKAAQELLFNVVKHARVSDARLRIRRLGRCICLSVSDRGRGFDPQALKETHGFGLFSLRERVELLGGRMRIKSALGRGSTFRIVMPNEELPPKERVLDREPNGRAKPGECAPGAGNGRLRVLLVDDHEIVREGLTLLLNEEPGVEVVGESSNGREAVDLVSVLRPDVVIMDVSMPLMSGDEATRQIKGHLPEVRIVALSMYEEPETAQRMYQAGAESYVLKTAPSEELLAAIRGKH
jgi:CheY-like chemotaxis protein